MKPRPLSMVEEEEHETVSRGTSPIPSPLLARDSNSSSSPPSTSDEPYHFRPIKLPDEETNGSFELPVEDNETARGPVSENAVIASHSDANVQIDVVDEDEDVGEEYTENMPELVNNRFYAMGSYVKEGEQEVNLREDAEVEVLEESDGGWWLVRTSSHSVGWAPSNFLEKVQSLKGSVEASSEMELPDENIIEVIPIRPPKSPKVLKMAQDMSVEKKFWYYIQKGKDTFPLDEQEKSGNTENTQLPSQAKEELKEVMAFTFDDYECDPESGICMRKSHKSTGVKFVPKNNVPIDQGHLQATWNGPVCHVERSESLPSLAESEDFDDLPSD